MWQTFGFQLKDGPGLPKQAESSKAMQLRLEEFEGAWVLERRINHDNAPDAQFRGSARFRSHGEGLVYEEKGLLKVDGHRAVSAQRSHLWRTGEGGVIEVLFEDGRPFHVIDLRSPSDTHFCDPDTYEVAYRFGGWPDWICTWKVTGPKKAYQMVSTYRRPVEGID
jgi:hypothetical protein